MGLTDNYTTSEKTIIHVFFPVEPGEWTIAINASYECEYAYRYRKH